MKIYGIENTGATVMIMTYVINMLILVKKINVKY